jgi:hypothetical protein
LRDDAQGLDLCSLQGERLGAVVSGLARARRRKGRAVRACMTGAQGPEWAAPESRRPVLRLP